MSNAFKDLLRLLCLILLDKDIIRIIGTHNKHRDLVLRQRVRQVGHNPDKTEIQWPRNLEASPGGGDLVFLRGVWEQVAGRRVGVRDDERDFFGGLGDAVPDLVVEEGEISRGGGCGWESVDCVRERV